MLRFPAAGTPGVIRLKIHPPTEQAIREQIQKALKLLKDNPLTQEGVPPPGPPPTRRQAGDQVLCPFGDAPDGRSKAPAPAAQVWEREAVKAKPLTRCAARSLDRYGQRTKCRQPLYRLQLWYVRSFLDAERRTWPMPNCKTKPVFYFTAAVCL
jgi:hypothetical protein